MKSYSEVEYMKEIKDKSVQVGVGSLEKSSYDPCISCPALAPETPCSTCKMP